MDNVQGIDIDLRKLELRSLYHTCGKGPAVPSAILRLSSFRDKNMVKFWRRVMHVWKEKTLLILNQLVFLIQTCTDEKFGIPRF